MPVASPDRVRAGTVLRSNFYLTDGRRLYRVLGVDDGLVELENCKVPDENPAFVRTTELIVGQWRVVRPA